MKKIGSLLCCLALILTLFSACGEEPNQQSEENELGTAVATQTVTRQDLSAESTVSGSVSAGNEAAVYAALQAEILTVDVEVGDAVAEGDVLCTLDVSTYQDNLSTLQSNYQTAQSSYESQKTLFEEQLSQAQTNLSNTQALFAIGAASQAEVDSAELTVLNLQTSMDTTLRSLSDSMKQIQDNIRPLQDTVAKGTVRAPIAGTVTALNAEVGSYAAPSYALATVSEDGNRKIIAQVSEALLPKLALGDTAHVSIGAADTDFDATISTVSPTANLQTQLYQVELDAPAGTALNAGMFASITFYTDTVTDAVVVPTEAILTDNTGSYVFVVEDGTAHRIDVTTGLIGNGVTEISAGLSGGETLVTAGQSYLSEGMAVRIVEA